MNSKTIHFGSSLSDYLNLINSEFEPILKNNKKDFSGLIEILDDFELNIQMSPNEYNFEIALFHILSYFIIWDLDNLRFLIKRLKSEIKDRQEVSLIIEAFRAVWKKNFPNAFNGLKNASVFFQNNQNISGLLVLLSDSMLENFKGHILKNFSVISIDYLKKMSGFSDKELDSFLMKSHWKKNAVNEINLQDQYENSKIAEVLEKQVGQLTEMVSFMDKLN